MRAGDRRLVDHVRPIVIDPAITNPDKRELDVVPKPSLVVRDDVHRVAVRDSVESVAPGKRVESELYTALLVEAIRSVSPYGPPSAAAKDALIEVANPDRTA